MSLSQRSRDPSPISQHLGAALGNPPRIEPVNPSRTPSPLGNEARGDELSAMPNYSLPIRQPFALIPSNVREFMLQKIGFLDRQTPLLSGGIIATIVNGSPDNPLPSTPFSQIADIMEEIMLARRSNWQTQEEMTARGVPIMDGIIDWDYVPRGWIPFNYGTNEYGWRRHDPIMWNSRWYIEPYHYFNREARQVMDRRTNSRAESDILADKRYPSHTRILQADEEHGLTPVESSRSSLLGSPARPTLVTTPQRRQTPNLEALKDPNPITPQRVKFDEDSTRPFLSIIPDSPNQPARNFQLPKSETMTLPELEELNGPLTKGKAIKIPILGLREVMDPQLIARQDDLLQIAAGLSISRPIHGREFNAQDIALWIEELTLIM
jgi:hypothetical protein